MIDSANIVLPPGVDARALASAAGQPDTSMEGGNLVAETRGGATRLYVRGVTQAALDAALAAYVDPPEVVAARRAELRRAFQRAIQRRLDDFARTRDYDGILSAATYATSVAPQHRVEGQYAVRIRDETWAAAFEILAEVEAGARPMPVSIADIESDLPQMEWPQ